MYISIVFLSCYVGGIEKLNLLIGGFFWCFLFVRENWVNKILESKDVENFERNRSCCFDCIERKVGVLDG